MPFLQIQTNLQVESEAGSSLLLAASALVAAELGKPEAYMMTALRDDQPMTLDGSGAPLAMVELEVLDLDREKVPGVVEKLAALTGERLNLASDRIFVKFTDVPRGQWAWNGKIF